MINSMQIEFEKKLVELGLSYSLNYDDFYTISSQPIGGNRIIVRLISSLPSNNQVNGSKNGNGIQGIGIFKFQHSLKGQEPDLWIFAFQNTFKNRAEFIIIPIKELTRKLIEGNRYSTKNQQIVFWLIPDNCLYETTNIGIEGEWYYLSKGLNGRMADNTDSDYTEFLNNWGRLAF